MLKGDDGMSCFGAAILEEGFLATRVVFGLAPGLDLVAGLALAACGGAPGLILLGTALLER